MKKIVLLVASLFLFQGCASNPVQVDGGVAPVIVDQTQSVWFKAIEPAVSTVCGLTLTFAASGQDQIDLANQIYGIAKAVRTLSGGAVPTVSDVTAVLNQWLPDQVKYASLTSVISGVYGTAYGKLQGNPKLAVQVLEQVSLGCERAAGSIIAGK